MDDFIPTHSGEAFVRALTESQTALRGYCQASLGHTEEAKEALQRTSIALWKKQDDWNPETAFLPWAITVAKFEVLGVIRDRKRESQRYVFDSEVVEQMVVHAEEATQLNPDMEEALAVCLGKLSPKNRESLSAYYTGSRSIQDIAQSQNRGFGAVRIMLMRLRRSLGICIERQLAKGSSI
jgi:RNA polymerase sigma-70 factor, ECF subfamily